MNKDMHLYSVCRRKKPNCRKCHQHRLFLNLLKQNFFINEPYRIRCKDFTYLYLTNWTVRYNCTIIDLHDCSVIASEIVSISHQNYLFVLLKKLFMLITVIRLNWFCIPTKAFSLRLLNSQDSTRCEVSQKAWAMLAHCMILRQCSAITIRCRPKR